MCITRSMKGKQTIPWLHHMHQLVAIVSFIMMSYASTGANVKFVVQDACKITLFGTISRGSQSTPNDLYKLWWEKHQPFVTRSKNRVITGICSCIHPCHAVIISIFCVDPAQCTAYRYIHSFLDPLDFGFSGGQRSIHLHALLDIYFRPSEKDLPLQVWSKNISNSACKLQTRPN